MEKIYCVYLLASSRYGTLYTGVTSDLVKRTWHHRQKLVGGFTKEYDVKKLVWYEIHEDVMAAITRETNQEMESRLEGQIDSRTAPALGRFG